MAGPNRKLIEEATYADSGEAHRIVHVEVGRYSFYEILRYSKGQGSGDNPDWTRVGGTEQTLEEARSASKMRNLHVVELRSLPRPDRFYGDHNPSAPRTPWGNSQHATTYGEGVESHGTAGHGGFKLDRKRNAQVDSCWRGKGGWYEEDGEWAIVAHTFPELFTTYERSRADQTLKNYHPDEYMQVTGDVLDVSESSALQERAFKEMAKDSWVVVSAVYADDDRSTTVCKATLGGKRPGFDEEWNDRTFMVPSAEYETRSKHGFIIDLERHEECEPHSPAMRM